MIKRLFFVLCMMLLLVACEGGDPVLAEECMDDSFESNDTSSSAKIINGNTKGVLYENLVVCPGDEDWFKVEVLEGECLTVSLTFIHLDGDIDLTIYDSVLTKLVSSASSTNNESAMTLPSLEDSDYLIKVFCDAVDLGNDYEMLVKLSTE